MARNDAVKAVKCKRHGLWYDPRIGCPRCEGKKTGRTTTYGGSSIPTSAPNLAQYFDDDFYQDSD